MKKFLALIVMPLALLATVPGLTGCAQLAGLTQNEQVSTYDEKALLTLERLYAFTLDSVLRAGNAGLINQSLAAKLVPVLNEADAAMQAARKLYADGAAVEGSAATARVFAALGELTAALAEAGWVK